MPELPEVETARRIVAATLVGLPLVEVELRLPKLLRLSELPTLDPLVGSSILAARRRAKVLILDWSNGLSLVGHLKMTGQVVIDRDGVRRYAGHPLPAPEGDFPHRLTHLTMRFAGDAILHLSDLRQFGWLRVMPTDAVPAFIASLKLGPEAIGDDGITVDALRLGLARRRVALKAALLDQGLLAGIGNIYVDEALHHARIHPSRLANSLEAAEVDRLMVGVRWALENGIAQGGAKIRQGKAFPVDGFPSVHARKGLPCDRCGTAIVKTVVGGRGTYLCPVCQLDPTPGSQGPRAAP
jgi:formamidopyrimidine-DNA glycosylase